MHSTPRSVGELVDAQVKRWMIERNKGARDHQPRRPVVTVSRQFGAQGAGLARLLSERLDYQLWDAEIVHEIAQRAGAPDDVFVSLDERQRNFVRDTLAVFGTGPRFTTQEYKIGLRQALQRIAEIGGAVIVGRGAQYVLDPARTLRIYVVCPVEQRVRSLIERHGGQQRAVRAHLEAVDATRQAFIREHYNRDVNDASAYDLVLNTGTLSLAICAEIAEAAFVARFGAPLSTRAART